ncbi:sulfate transporter family protein [Aureimonas fodinaquatilis]|uniref:Sulfate transporter family protein n=1 Tax=Aureimonas fodinaquatilis TaxID=2565783 RepID=A0A5B0DYX0_9HYPH|nr:sulfate transporter family protein [Aureimonas fodinaquatilis]KAA0971713.1 sulfate transporter family protein [Aureimonas fodinaquatilis]
MIFSSASLALRDIFSPPFRSALWKVLGLTAICLVALWFAVRWLFEILVIPFFAGFAPDMPSWVDNAGTFAGFAASIALAFLLAFLIAPVSAIIAGLFLDDVAETVEVKDYPQHAPGRALPFWQSTVLSIKFFGIVVLGNLIAFALLWLPLVNIVAFFIVNGYLLGREYFQFASLRFRTIDEAAALRDRHGARIFMSGLLIAAFLAIPVLNLLTPLFAAAMMVHLHQKISIKEGGLAIVRPDSTSR